MDTIAALVRRAREGHVESFGALVRATQGMAYSVARTVLGDPAAAEDAVQQAYLRAFRRLDDLQDPEAFPAWLRRLVVTVSLNERRRTRRTFLRLDDVPEVPVLDEQEDAWSPSQRMRLAEALLTLSDQDRQICDRKYHGAWSTSRLASAIGVEDGAMRKRLQRIRDKLRRAIEMTEQRELVPGELPPNLPSRVVELLARPRLTDLPENPVGQVQDLLRGAFADFAELSLPEMINLSTAAGVAADAMYVDPVELHRVDGERILRYDLTLPLLLTVHYAGQPMRVWASGKTYRVCRENATHLEAFHQAEAFWLDETSRVDAWQIAARVLQAVDRVLPGRAVKMVPTEYPMCTQAWELEVEESGQWTEVLAWGLFNDRILTHIGADPSRHAAVGAGFGLERLAMMRFGIDDIRKIDVARVGFTRPAGTAADVNPAEAGSHVLS